MAFKISNVNIIDDSRNILNATAVGIGTTNPTSVLHVIGNTLATGISTASRFVSNVAQGTAPISVASSTIVTNLNADYLDGNDSTYYTTANNLTGTAPAGVISQSSGLTVTGNVSISGNLSVGGTSVILNAATLQVKDRDIILGITTDANQNDVATDATATHGGVSIASTTGTPIFDMPQQAGINSLPSTYKQWMWISSATGGNFSGVGTDAWISNYAIGIGTLALRNGSRLTVGAGFTVFDTYLDATDIRARHISAVTNINASGIVTATNGFSGNINATGINTLTNITGTNLNYTGISTATNLGGTNLSYTGISTLTNITGTNLNYTGISTATNLGGTNLSYTGISTLTNITGTNLNYTGISTITTIATNTNINSSGIHTASQYYVGSTKIHDTVSGQITLSGIATIDATTKATLERELAFAPNDFNSLNVTGISTLQTTTLIGGGTSTGTAGQVLQVSGISSGAYIGGNLGIGVTNPTQPLDVNGNARLRAGLYDSTNQVGAAGSILISTGAGVSWTTVVGAGAATNIVDDISTTTPKYLIFTSTTSGSVTTENVSSTKLSYIASSGSLGIGTTSPTDNLDVNGTIRLRSSLKDFNNNVGAAGSILISTGAGVSWTSITGAGGASVSIVDDTATATPKYLLFTSATSGSVTSENVSSTKLSYIASSGSLGIGTTSPTDNLDVNGTIRLRSTLKDFNNNVGAAGSVLISTGAGVSWTSITGAGGASITIADDTTTNASRYLLFTSATSGSVTTENVSSTKLVYNPSSGNLGIGSAIPTAKLDVLGDVRVSGIVTAGDFNSTSDRKLKTNIQPIINPIEKVLQISGVSFNWKETGKATLGVIAQEIELVLPELVSDTDPKTVNYNGLIGLLIECVKDQQKQIDELKGKL